VEGYAQGAQTGRESYFDWPPILCITTNPRWEAISAG